MAFFRPAILDSFSEYSRQQFSQDILAGITVGVIALPLAMAFAIASGLKPEAGIFAAIIGGLIVALFGGTKVQIAGPAGAFIVIVYAIVDRYGVANLLLATTLSGVFLFLMGTVSPRNSSSLYSDRRDCWLYEWHCSSHHPLAN